MCGRTFLAGAILAIANIACPVLLQAEVDQGMARYVPWSGSFWPIREGALIRGPLTKYDRLTGHQAVAWELQENPPDASVPEWYGYCHAWAAAAVLDPEPQRLRTARSLDGQAVALGIGDQKGMLTACHTDDVAQHYGVRFQGEPEDDAQDIYPDQLWRVMKLFIQQRGIPLIVDIEGGTQVWNYPVYAYRVDYQPAGSGHRYLGTMTLWMADDAVPEDIIGVQVSKQTYYFSFELRNGAAQMGTGRWVEPSVNNHPDFAWYPHVVRPENPELHYEQVKQLVDRSAAGPSDRPAAPLETRPSNETSIPLDSQPTPSLIPILPPNIVPPNVTPSGTGQPHAGPDGPTAAGPSSVVSPSVVPGWPLVSSPSVPAEGGLSGAPRPRLLSPVELLSLVTNHASHFTFDVTVDKFDGGHYMVGETITIRGTSERDAFLYLFYLDGHGGLSVLFPGVGESNQVRADQRFQLPATDRVFRVVDQVGVHRIKAVATSRPLMFTGLSPTLQLNGPVGTFRLPPSQEAMFQSQLAAHVQGKRLPAKAVGGETLAALAGSFAQDEVAFYVGPATPIRSR